jgi:SAM-dependent methyltransferase
MKNKNEIKDYIRKNYGMIAGKTSEGNCCSSGCGCNGIPLDISDSSIKVGYTKDDLSAITPDANMGLGCGNPVAIASIKEGEAVLDLGSGGGFDCFLASRQTGDKGHVIGVDMTAEMINLARRNAEKGGYMNVEFRLGEIEHLPVADGSVDVIISNCVINLSPDKEQVFKDAFRVLKHGGRLSTSDIVATAKLPQKIKEDLALVASCVGGAEYVEDIKTMLQNAGFKNIKMTPKDNSKEIISTWVPGKDIENYVASYTIEAIKP